MGRIKANDELYSDKTKNPVVRDTYVLHGNQWLDEVVDSLATDTGKKANRDYVDAELAKKANVSTVTELTNTVDTKASAADVTVLQTKTATLETTVSGKADNTTVSSLSERVTENTTKTVDLQHQIDSLVIEAGGDSNPEVVQARTDASGVTHATLKSRIDSEVTDLKSDFSKQLELGESTVINESGSTIKGLNKFSYEFKAYNRYRVTVTVGGTKNRQIGVLKSDGNYAISRPYGNEPYNNFVWEFTLEENAVSFAIYTEEITNFALSIDDISTLRNDYFETKEVVSSNVNRINNTTKEISTLRNHALYSESKVENALNYNFVKGELYRVIVNSTDVSLLQFGTTDSGRNNYIDKSETFKEDLNNYEWVFEASDNSADFLVYKQPSTAQVSYTIEHLTNVDSSEMLNKEYMIDSSLEKVISYPFHFKKGQYYSVKYSSTGGTTQAGTALKVGDSEYIDSSPIISRSLTNYEWKFKATEDAFVFVLYRTVEGNSNVSITEYFNKEDKKTRNSVTVAEFNGTKNDDIIAPDWAQNDGYISITHSGQNFIDGAMMNKYITAYDRALIYDFVPHENAIACAYTQRGEIESFYAQGWCVYVDFQNGYIFVRKNYGSQTNVVSTAIPAAYETFRMNFGNYSGRKYRFILKRNKYRGLCFEMYELEKGTKICEINTPFDSSIVPAYGLGYDKMAFASLQGTIDLYAMRETIANATNPYLYIVGDSITEGVGVRPEDAYAYIVASKIPNTIVSGRGGGNINGVFSKLETEVSVLKPKYVMVTIGTNGGNTSENLNQLVDRIRELGAEPIINHIPCTSTSTQASVNAIIGTLDCKHVKMDVATALNYDISNGPDASLFVEDGTHPNEEGHKRMADRVFIDCPELFN